ncbi:hypothetical protein GKZ68_14835 [Hymenobacter sp. BRD128]|uniref:hypothetical protein n=1 Tax=Hymenobacter sp. BRD128 TaxID=2675878 RepID=UPI0015666EDD|nr:hypothetical protein [Hymenobacter sp. BRD128]QKG57787.1 hypothetical protein GKZ68_14835 [Hymenobacter sp. BRD128]
MTFSFLSSGRVVRWAAITSLVAGLGLATQPATAQSALTTIRLLPEDAERGQYGHQHNFYFLPPGKTGEDYQNAGFFGGKLRPYLGNNSSALAELDHYKANKTAYLIDKIVLVGAAGLYGSQVFGHGDAQYHNSTQQVAAGVAVASLLATIFINRHTNEHFKQAVDNYNTGTSGVHGTRWPRLRPAGVGLATSTGHPVLALRWQL